jgi:CRP-like cAMP-binding protein
MESAARSQNARPQNFPLENAFLASLSADDLSAINPHLRTVELSQGFSLIELGQVFTHVYFPHTAVISLVVDFASGEQVEVAMIGRDTILGAFSVLGEPVALSNAVILMAGSASMLAVDRLRAVADGSASLRASLVRHGQAIFVQAMQTAGCNASHSVEARLARWLLRVRDLSGSDRFALTQELMAHMIGARRNSVSFVAHTLQQVSCIKYSRGHIEIGDLGRLTRAACECYAATKAQHQRLRFPV